MSSLNITAGPAGWRAFPGPETTIAQIVQAAERFPELDVVFNRENGDVSFVLLQEGEPPNTQELAAALFGDDHELIVSEDTGTFELPDMMDVFDQEAADRHLGEDLDLGDLDPEAA